MALWSEGNPLPLTRLNTLVTPHYRRLFNIQFVKVKDNTPFSPLYVTQYDTFDGFNC